MSLKREKVRVEDRICVVERVVIKWGGKKKEFSYGCQ
jgi:hypothetical protein